MITPRFFLLTIMFFSKFFLVFFLSFCFPLWAQKELRFTNLPSLPLHYLTGFYMNSVDFLFSRNHMELGPSLLVYGTEERQTVLGPKLTLRIPYVFLDQKNFTQFLFISQYFGLGSSYDTEVSRFDSNPVFTLLSSAGVGVSWGEQVPFNLRTGVGILADQKWGSEEKGFSPWFELGIGFGF